MVWTGLPGVSDRKARRETPTRCRPGASWRSSMVASAAPSGKLESVTRRPSCPSATSESQVPLSDDNKGGHVSAVTVISKLAMFQTTYETGIVWMPSPKVEALPVQRRRTCAPGAFVRPAREMFPIESRGPFELHGELTWRRGRSLDMRMVEIRTLSARPRPRLDVAGRPDLSLP